MLDHALQFFLVSPLLSHLVRMSVYVSPKAVDVFHLEMVQTRESVSLDLLMLQQDAMCKTFCCTCVKYLDYLDLKVH